MHLARSGRGPSGEKSARSIGEDHEDVSWNNLTFHLIRKAGILPPKGVDVKQRCDHSTSRLFKALNSVSKVLVSKHFRE